MALPVGRVIEPNSLSSWEEGETYQIRWTGTPETYPFVAIELYDSGLLIITITGSSPNDGVYNWTVPHGLQDSSLYQIKIVEMTD